MIRYVHIEKGKIDDDIEYFSFYCTVKDEFKSFSGSQIWDSIEDFKEDYLNDRFSYREELSRYINKIIIKQ